LTAAVDSISLTTVIDFGNKAIVIKGVYTATDTLFISGANNSGIFDFNGAGKVVLDSLVLINGNANFGGAVSYRNNANDTLHISNSTIKWNTATNDGGGIYARSSAGPSSVVITNSSINGNTASNGGGIYSKSDSDPSTVDVTNSTISGNTLSNGQGGGIYSYSYSSSSTVTISNSTISENTAYGSGGGIYSNSEYFFSLVEVSNSTISGNTASRGGGIYSNSDNSTSTVDVTNSTISGNIADSDGGGIYSNSNNSTSTIDVTNATISGNTADGSGGGIFSDSDFNPSTLDLTNSTISGNTATSNGGGIYSNSSNLAVTARSCIFEGSSISNNNVNSITSYGYNVFDDVPTGATGTEDATGVILNLGPLAFNGGTTKTMLPAPGSVVIDMGDPSDMSDAQNQPISGGRRDVGAAETVCNTTQGTHNETVCLGGSIVVNGTTYDANNLTGTEVFTNVGPSGCDSTVTVTLTIENAIDVTTTTNGLTITANQTGAAYQWIDCNNSNNAIIDSTNITFTAMDNGDYAVVVTVGNCSDTSACVNINTVGVHVYENLSNNIYIYPNPTVNKLTIEYGNLNINNISILNISGEIVRKTTVNTNIIDVSNLTKGIYFLQIYTENGLVSKKFIKE
jgi:predicted outer membrane repeat protein